MGNISEDIQSTFPSNQVKALINIKYTANWLSSREIEFFKPFGLSPQQFNVLRILRGAGEPTKVQIVKDRMIERAPNATRMMDKLCEKELIARHRCDHDRRVVFVEITEKGLSLLKEIDNLEGEIDFLNKLTEEEAGVLSDLLDKLR